MRFGSVCSGIEAASVAWDPLGWSAEWFAEIEAFPSLVLAHHWPDVPNLGDMLGLPGMVSSEAIAAPDVLVGGTPCQAFSVAGRRGSLEDERGALTLAFVELIDEIDRARRANGHEPAVVVWENVPGVLSTKDNAFGCFLAGLAGESQPLFPAGGKWTNAGCVFGPERTVAWRILDAQYFGVAQQRRRVFVVASAREGFDPCEVLFEREGLRRDSAPSREDDEKAAADYVLAFTASSFGAYTEGVGTLRANGGDLGGGSETLIAMPLNTQIVTRGGALGRGTGFGLGSETDPSFTLQAGHSHGVFTAPAMAFTETADCLTSAYGTKWNGNASADNGSLFAYDTRLAVRRLTPRECERLQGFPDDHTLVPHRGKPAADGPRYKAIGNSMAVPVMRWIGQRIADQIEGA